MTDVRELYAVKVRLRTGVTLNGFVKRGYNMVGSWVTISKTIDMKNIIYINPVDISFLELSENK